MYVHLKRGVHFSWSNAYSKKRVICDQKKVAIRIEDRFIRWKLHIKEGEAVTAGQIVATDRACTGRCITSPSGGTIDAILYGDKRSLEAIILSLAGKESKKKPLDPVECTHQAWSKRMVSSGILEKGTQYPFGLVPSINERPRAIFINAMKMSPLSISPGSLIRRSKNHFRLGLQALLRFSPDNIIVIHEEKERKMPLPKGIQQAFFSGPFPANTASAHIYHLDPVRSVTDRIWAFNAEDVIHLGACFGDGRLEREKQYRFYDIDKKKAYAFTGKEGLDIRDFSVDDRLWLSDDPVRGNLIAPPMPFAFPKDTLFVSVEEEKEREMFHFMRIGFKKQTAHRTYFSLKKYFYPNSNNQHGEERAIVDGEVYDLFYPFDHSISLLAKALLARNFDDALQMGMLDFIPEDFLLASYVCPSKVDFFGLAHRAYKGFLQENGFAE